MVQHEEQIRIRPLAADDRQRWEQLFDAYAAFYNAPVPEGGFERVWDWIVDPGNDFWCDVLEVDGEIAGFSQYQLMHRSLSGPMVCYLSDLFVEPKAQGLGGGRVLIDRVLDFARARDITNVR